LADKKNVYTIDISKLKPASVKSKLAQLSSSLLCGYDVKSHIKLLSVLGIEAKNVGYDVLVGSFLINPLIRSQALTDLAQTYLDFQGSSLEDLPNDELMNRAPEVAAIVNGLYEQQQSQLTELPKLAKLAKDVEWPLTGVLADMEMFGVKLDTKYLKNFAKKLEGSISDTEQTIYGHANHEFNIGSPGQLAEVLFTKLNLSTAGIKRGKTGFSTAASELDKLRGSHPIIDLITQYREVVKLKNTYVDTLPQMVDTSSRLHTTFNLTIAPTGRLSSADPNLQNIPVRTELGRKIRTAFIADKGNVLVSADYSQIELRLAAALSGDKGMIDAFNKDEDIHVQTAALVMGIPPAKVTKQDRYAAKAVNFGIMYGQGPHGLSQQTGMDFSAAREFISKYFQIRPKLSEYIEHLRKQAAEAGYVETIMGRRRPTPDVKSPNFAVREAAYRAAINHPMQGSAADLMKMAMIEVDNKLDKNSHMLLQIHDSILVETPAAKAKAVG
jgi:DNA polymerase-1